MARVQTAMTAESKTVLSGGCAPKTSYHRVLAKDEARVRERCALGMVDAVQMPACVTLIGSGGWVQSTGNAPTTC